MLPIWCRPMRVLSFQRRSWSSVLRLIRSIQLWRSGFGYHLGAGTSVRAEMIAETVPSALVIPQAAVLTSPSGNTSVMIIDSENKPHKKPVTLGIRESGNVQIIEGLASGERVVTIGAFELAKLEEDVLAKTKVQIQAPKEEDE